MAIFTIYELHCTQCNCAYEESFDDLEDVKSYAKKNGWLVDVTVENGSLWDFCPKCSTNYLSEEDTE